MEGRGSGEGEGTQKILRQVSQQIETLCKEREQRAAWKSELKDKKCEWRLGDDVLDLVPRQGSGSGSAATAAAAGPQQEAKT